MIATLTKYFMVANGFVTAFRMFLNLFFPDSVFPYENLILFSHCVFSLGVAGIIDAVQERK